MAARAAGAQTVSLLKQGWHEVPDLVISLGLVGAGTLLACVQVYRYHLKGMDTYKYRQQYTVIRDTDVKDPSLLGTRYN